MYRCLFSHLCQHFHSCHKFLTKVCFPFYSPLSTQPLEEYYPTSDWNGSLSCFKFFCLENKVQTPYSTIQSVQVTVSPAFPASFRSFATTQPCCLFRVPGLGHGLSWLYPMAHAFCPRTLSSSVGLRFSIFPSKFW